MIHSREISKVEIMAVGSQMETCLELLQNSRETCFLDSLFQALR